MSDLLKKAKLHMRIAEEGDRADITLNLCWTVAYSLVATAEGVWEIVKLLRAVHPSEATVIEQSREKS